MILSLLELTVDYSDLRTFYFIATSVIFLSLMITFSFRNLPVIVTVLQCIMIIFKIVIYSFDLQVLSVKFLYSVMTII